MTKTVLTTKVLLQLLQSPEKGEALSLSSWQSIILILREAKLISALYHSAQKKERFDKYPEYAQKHLKSSAVYAERQLQQVLYECQMLEALFESADFKPVYLKGAAYMLASTENCHGRVLSDIDVLVNKSSLSAAEVLLKNNLWRAEEVSDYDDKYYREWAHEIPPMFHALRGTVIDLHHNLYLPVSGRAISVNELMVEQTSTGHSVLSKPDMLFHSIVHLFTNEDTSSGARDSWDMYILGSELDDDDWQRVIQLAEQFDFCKEVYYCVELLINYYEFSPPKCFFDFIERHKFGGVVNLLAKKVYPLALSPQHPFTQSISTILARQLIYIRGHWLKMPAHILFRHLLVKSWIGLVSLLIGKQSNLSENKKSDADKLKHG